MLPVNFLFEDIYRNDWAIRSQAKTEARRDRHGPWARDPRLLVERKPA